MKLIKKPLNKKVALGEQPFYLVDSPDELANQLMNFFNQIYKLRELFTNKG